MLLLALVLSFSMFLACATTNSGDDDDDDDDDDDNDDNMVGEETTIYEIQQGNVAGGTRVLLSQVVVTSGMNAEGEGFFIREQAGGEFSGIYVFVTGEATGEISPVVGDLINIAGEYDEYYELSELTLAAVGDYEVVDHAGDPVADQVTTGTLADPTEAEKWEGVLVQVNDVSVVTEINNYNEFEINNGVMVDDMFFSTAPNPPVGTVFNSLTGPFTYNYNFKICPRDVDDFDGDWQPEPGDDDDDDDDDDDSTDTTIYDIQQGEVDEGDTVTVEGVVTTPTGYEDGDLFFMQDEDGGEYSGIAVYMWSEIAATYDGEPGDIVRVTGEVSEFYDMTELVVKNYKSGVEIIGSTDVPDPENIAVGDVGEPWESVFVQVSDVTVTAEPNQYGEFTVEGSLVIDDFFFELGHWEDYGISVDDTFSSIAGVLNYSYEEFKLEPRSDSDLVE